MPIRASTPLAHGRSAVDGVRSVSGMEQLPDSVLVERSLTGDRWADEMLYRRHAPTLLGLCTRLLRDGADAEDVVQDAFVDALEELATLREPAQFRKWLTGIAVHKVHRRLRRRKLLRALGLWEPRSVESLESCLAPGVSAEHYADIVCLDLALRKLADTLRISWELRYIEGFRLEEVAEHCACSLATVKRRIAEAEALVHRYIDFEGARRA